MYSVLFHIFGFEIQSYPLVVALGVLLASLFLVQSALRSRLSLDFLTDYYYWFLGVMFLGARIGGIIESWEMYAQHPLRLISFFDGGYNFYGSFIGFLLFLVVLSLWKKENIWKWVDIFALPAVVFFLFLSIADFLAGNNYGIPTSLPWAVTFNIPEVRYTIPIHPVQIYEVILLSVLFLFLLRKRKFQKYDGVLASYAMTGVFLIQGGLSYLRGVPETLIFDLRLSFLFSVFFLGIGVVLLVLRTHPHIHFLHNNDTLS